MKAAGMLLMSVVTANIIMSAASELHYRPMCDKIFNTAHGLDSPISGQRFILLTYNFKVEAPSSQETTYNPDTRSSGGGSGDPASTTTLSSIGTPTTTHTTEAETATTTTTTTITTTPLTATPSGRNDSSDIPDSTSTSEPNTDHSIRNDGSSVDPDKRRHKRSDLPPTNTNKNKDSTDADCSCTVANTTSINITVLEMWSALNLKGSVSLEVRGAKRDNSPVKRNVEITTRGSPPYPKKIYDSTTDSDLSITVHSSQNTTTFVLFVAVYGDLSMTITCPGSDDAATTFDTTMNTNQQSKAGTDKEKTSDMGIYMLIVGAGLMAVACLLLVAAGLTWHRYRARRLKRKEQPIEMDVFPQDKYEDVTNTEGDFAIADRIDRDPPSKSSIASLNKHDDAVSSRSQSQDLAHAADGSKQARSSSSPATSFTGRFSFLRKKHSKKDKRKKAADQSLQKQNDDQEDYSTVHSELYEVISDPPSPKRGLKIPTPLRLDVNALATINTLKKVGAQDWAKNKPKLELPAASRFSQDIVQERQDEYSHLDRSGRSMSFDLSKVGSYDRITLVKTEKEPARCTTAGILETNSDMFNFPELKSERDKEMDFKAGGESDAKEVQGNPDNIYEDTEGDHIYEAYERSPDLAGKTTLNVLNIGQAEGKASASHKNSTTETSLGTSSPTTRIPECPLPPVPKGDNETKSPADTHIKPRHDYDYMTNEQLAQEIKSDDDGDKVKDSNKEELTVIPLDSAQDEATYETVQDFDVPSTRSAAICTVEDPITNRADSHQTTHHDTVIIPTTNAHLPAEHTDARSDSSQSGADHKKSTENITSPVLHPQSPDCQSSTNTGSDQSGQGGSSPLTDLVLGPDGIQSKIEEPEEYVITENILYEPVKLKESPTEINVKL